MSAFKRMISAVPLCVHIFVLDPVPPGRVFFLVRPAGSTWVRAVFSLSSMNFSFAFNVGME